MTDIRRWTREAVRIIEADFQRSADTHLIPLALPGLPGVELYFKDESSHPTGSLKHRLARSLFLYALCNGWLKPAAIRSRREAERDLFRDGRYPGGTIPVSSALIE